MRLYVPTIAVLIFLGAGAASTSAGDAVRLIQPAERIEGVVRDPAGQLLFAVQIQLLREGRVVLATRTGTDGRFSLEPRTTPGPGGWVLRASSLGFTTLERPVEPGEGSITLVLSPAPLPIRGFDVLADRDICAENDDPEARALWVAAATRHPGGLDTLGIASYTRIRTDTLNGAGGGTMGIEGSEFGQRGSAPLLRLSWSRRLRSDGYAFRVRRTDSERSFDSWSYPPLEADFSFHFGDILFGELNEFHFEHEGPESWTVSFCGRNTRRPHLIGRIEIGADTLIHLAEWRFRTPDPDEGAGGWVRFSPSAAEPGPRFLLPMESMTWRSVADSVVVRRAQWYDGWILAPGDSVPFLPAQGRP